MSGFSWLLVPRDGLFLKDGRGWQTTESGRARTLSWPFPSTVLGAVRTAWGRALEDHQGGRTLSPGEWPERTSGVRLDVLLPVVKGPDGAWERLWPAPADALGVAGHPHFVRLDPVPDPIPTLGAGDDPATVALWRPLIEAPGKPRPAGSWWTERMFLDWLSGAEVPCPPDGTVGSIVRARRIRLSVDPSTGTARDGMLFSTESLEPFIGGSSNPREWGIALSGAFPDGIPCAPDWVVLGGDQRVCRVERMGEDLLDPPRGRPGDSVEAQDGLRLLAVTPASFEQGWVPDGFRIEDGRWRGHLPGLEGEPLVLCAARVNRPEAVSGWDVAQGRPKPTERLVPAGSVYFVKKQNDSPFRPDEIRKLWMFPWGRRTAEGFGRFVAAAWKTPHSVQEVSR